ncbi:AmmeMemoRadiSam system radical SAM enzyme [Chloroflexota bacterium]
MQEAMLYQKLPGGMVRCQTCQWRCRILQGKAGVCGMYRNEGGMLQNLNYALVSAAVADPIEKKPLFHFYPGSTCFSLGTLGCNFRCRHCQNWEISTAKSGELAGVCRKILPEQAVQAAQEQGCRGLAWTYNEPAVWLEYTLDSAILAKQQGLYTVWVTNGYASEAALDAIGPYLDAWRVDIKGFSDNFYQQIAGVPHWREIPKVTKRAKEKWHMHVEVVTNIIPGFNDDARQLADMAEWIYNELGELTPWHVTRFLPHHQMPNTPPTPVEAIENALAIGRAAGLKFVYAGNLAGHPAENTNCYNCGAPVIRRSGYEVEIMLAAGGYCTRCGAALNIVGIN